MVRRCWVNFECRGVLLTWITVGQGPIVLAVGAGGGLCGHFYSHLSILFSFSLSLWETARYRLKYCLKGPFGSKQPRPTKRFLVFISAPVNLFLAGPIFALSQNGIGTVSGSKD